MRAMAGCVPVTANGHLCLVSSRHNPGLLVFPKGGVKQHEAFQAAALRETIEEAGVEGPLIGSLGEVGECLWYVMQVDKIHDRWAEMDQRQRHFEPVNEAHLRPDLKETTRKLVLRLQRFQAHQ